MSTSGGVGYSIYSVSILWLAYQISGNLVVAGAVLFVELATYSLTFVIGPLVDRAADKRTIFLACFPVQAAAAGALALGLSRGFLTIPLLLGLVVVISLLWDFAWAAGNTATRLLLSPDEMFAAQGLSGLVNGGNTVAGYAVGGTLILLVGAGGGLLLYAVLLALAAGLAIWVRVPAAPTVPSSFGPSFREGWKTVFAGEGRPLLLLSLMDGVRGFVSNGPALLITLAANVIFRDPAQAYGVLFTVYIVGGVASGLIWGHINPRHRVGPLLVLSLVVTGIAVVLGVRSAPLWVATLPLWFLAGFAIDAYTGARSAFLEGSLPADQLGRVTSNLYLFQGVTSAIGALVIGLVAVTWTPLEVAGLVAGGFVVAGLLGAVFPAVRRLRY